MQTTRYIYFSCRIWSGFEQPIRRPQEVYSNLTPHSQLHIGLISGLNILAMQQQKVSKKEGMKMKEAVRSVSNIPPRPPQRSVARAVSNLGNTW